MSGQSVRRCSDACLCGHLLRWDLPLLALPQQALSSCRAAPYVPLHTEIDIDLYTALLEAMQQKAALYLHVLQLCFSYKAQNTLQTIVCRGLQEVLKSKLPEPLMPPQSEVMANMFSKLSLASTYTSERLHAKIALQDKQ